DVEVVPDRFGIEPSSREVREQAILRIHLQRLRSAYALHFISARQHHEPVQMFDAPPVRDKLARQPVEQLGMRWWLALSPEIIWRPDNSLAKMPRPNSIHNHARGQWIFVRRSKPFRQSSATSRRR